MSGKKKEEKVIVLGENNIGLPFAVELKGEGITDYVVKKGYKLLEEDRSKAALSGFNMMYGSAQETIKWYQMWDRLLRWQGKRKKKKQKAKRKKKKCPYKIESKK